MAGAAAPRRSGHEAQRRRLALGAIVALTAIGVALPGCGGEPGVSGVQGSGIPATQTRAVTRLAASIWRAATRSLWWPAASSQAVHADSNLIGHIRTRVVAGTLVIDDIGSYPSKNPMSIQVTSHR